MNDVITRLHLESSEYDNKLKKAVSQMQQMEKEVRRTGATFAVADEQELEFVRSLGQMQTAANSAKGKVAELKNAFTDLSVMYQNMTEEEKSSPIGQAMQGSLSQLKGRISDLSGQLSTASSDMGNFGGILEGVAQKFGLPIGSIGKMGSALSQLAGKGFGAIASAASSAGKAIVTGLGPVGIAIGAIVAAVKQLVDAFKRNEDAMAAVQKIAAPFKAIWQSIQRLFDDMVRIFVDVYNNLEKAAGGFSGFRAALVPLAAVIAGVRAALAIVGTVLTDIAKGIAFVTGKIREAMRGSTVGTWLKSITDAVQGFFTKFTDWVNKIANSKLGKALGLDTLAVQLRDIIHAQGELTAANKKIAESENALNKLRRKNDVDTAKALREIAKLREQASEKDKYSASERVRMLEQAASLEEANLQRELDIRRKEYELIKLKNSLTQSGTEDLNAETQAQVALINAETEYYNRMKALQKQLQTAKNEAGVSTGASDVSAVDGSIAAQEERVKQLTEQWKNATAELRDGYKKQLDEAQKVLDEMMGKKPAAVEEQSVPLQFNVKGVSDLKKKVSDALGDLEIGSKDYTQAAKRLVDFSTFENLLNTSVKNGLTIDTDAFGEQFRKIDLGIDVTDDEWQSLVDSINEQLAGMGLNPIQLNFETGNLSEVKQVVVDEFKELTDELSSGVGAISTLGNAFDNLKNIGEDLASAFSGEMDAWDSLMTVFNSGISIMETVVGVMEAINTLQELSAALKAKNAAAAGTEAAAVVAGKTAETTAEATNTAASGAATAANTAEAASGAGKAMSGIPIVGPILAVLAIAAVLGAIMAAVSKSKSAGNSFSGGGMVDGNSPSGDNVVAWLNSDEGVLTRKGVGNARDMAMAAQAGNGNLRLHTDVSGTDLRIVLDNDNRSQGGSRGAYSRIK